MLLQSNMVVSVISLHLKGYVHHTSHNVLHVYNTVKVLVLPYKNAYDIVLFPSTYKGELHINFLI